LTKKPPFIKPLFIGARTFTRAAKTGTPFAIYPTSTSGETTASINIPAQYKEFQDIFKKKNATSCPSTDRMIVPLIFKMELNHRLNLL
jgi:hypothetical protein